MSVVCNYANIIYINGDRFYGCKIFGKEIDDNQDIKIIGSHQYGKTNDDVKAVEINFCDIKRIPQGLTKIFPNLKVLYIISSAIKNLSKNDLVEYRNLERFHCETSKLEFLPGDLFEDFKNLEWIGFHGNKLSLIEPKILDGLDKLNYVDFGSNPNYNMFYSTFSAYQSNATLQDVKKQLSEKFSKSNFKISRNFSSNVQRNCNDDNFVNDIKNHIMNENFKDFFIEIGNQKFHVHKFLIAARSPFLADILCKNPRIEHLKLVDIPVKTFELILNFLYTDEMPLDDNNDFLSIFVAASHLKLMKLANFAASKIMDGVNESNVLEIFELSKKYTHDELSQKAFEVLRKKYSHIKFEDGWLTKMDKVKEIIIFLKKMEAIEREFSEKMKEH